ncbi:cysteine desulfurase sulfur acceptor subunit CsdE [Tatumella citrea]|uniref:Cysteine desulfurase, sulfur acceptor subunit CsdE n=1 Tax=Tatumella citrea TaxID=53336 RepID=A0A1Y0L524_TATCI|nr:cysteine desulfurase sulfur acceptor subunit CsdE [Tatumella citrea]ARU93132.1 cysteine desulfurase, sulfur acceptor subunit CsdE [Tatumella citrea]ARU97170.1 cysteine desulfurase, sulfur acceptor subunit CsdE [Tatumella citrea]
MKEIIAPHPFGTEITEAMLLQQFSGFQHWEERYRQLIMLSRQLPPLPDALKQPEIEISGCENRVWLGCEKLTDGRLHFYGDSEGRIVKGLLAILLTINEGKTASEILNQEPLAIFEKLGLKQQLSTSRSSGLDALAAAIRRAAEL